MSHGGVDRDEATNREESKGLLLARDHDDAAHDHGHGMVVIMYKKKQDLLGSRA